MSPQRSDRIDADAAGAGASRTHAAAVRLEAYRTVGDPCAAAAFRAAFAGDARGPGRTRGDDVSYAATFFSPLETSTKEFWIARVGGAVVGRLAASCSPTRAAVGYLGLFEVDLQAPTHATVAKTLLAAGAAWLAARGVKTAYGPVDVNTWFRYRLAAGRSAPDNPRFGWEPATAPEYLAAFAAAGFAPSARFHSVGFESRCYKPALRILKGSQEGALRRGYSFRPFRAAGAGLDEDLVLLHTLTHATFAASPLFEPLPLALFCVLYQGIVSRVDYSPSRFIVDPDGKACGYLFGFVDQDYVVVKTVSVLPEVGARAHGRWAASNALLHACLAGSVDRGLRGGVSALVREDASSAIIERRQSWASAWRNDYVLMARALG